jgi:formylmethanofuran dehydrogenase subunit A
VAPLAVIVDEATVAAHERVVLDPDGGVVVIGGVSVHEQFRGSEAPTSPAKRGEVDAQV